MRRFKLRSRTWLVAAGLAAAGWTLWMANRTASPGSSVTWDSSPHRAAASDRSDPSDQSDQSDVPHDRGENAKRQESAKRIAAPSDEIPAYPATFEVQVCEQDGGQKTVRLCQAAGSCFTGVDGSCNRCGEPLWDAARPIPWEAFAQGEYVGPHRLQHVPEYRLRTNDQVQVIFRQTRERSDRAYRLNVGDEIRVETVRKDDQKVDRNLIIQPDGTISLPLLNRVPAAGRTVDELRADLDERYKRFLKDDIVSVTPLNDSTKLRDLLAAIRVNFGSLAQGQLVVVTPEGTVQLVGLGSVFVQGLTMDETRTEIIERYTQLVGDGIDATPILLQRAPRFIFVVGEARTPNQYTLTGPTTVMQAVAMAGGWNVGANLRQIVVFRRTDEWRLMATKIDLSGALYGQRPSPADEIWLRDQDIVLLPKSPILRTDDGINLLFTRGLYSVVPGVQQAFSFGASRL